jgi:hypothetical protein
LGTHENVKAIQLGSQIDAQQRDRRAHLLQ